MFDWVPNILLNHIDLGRILKDFYVELLSTEQKKLNIKYEMVANQIIFFRVFATIMIWV